MEQATDKLRKHQLDCVNVLKDLILFLQKSECRYVIGAGTLLGAVRNNSFIPWDDDIDIFMPIEDFNSLQSMACQGSSITADYGFVFGQGMDPYHIGAKSKKGKGTVDIFPIERFSHYRLLKIMSSIQTACLKCSNALVFAGIFPDTSLAHKSWFPLFAIRSGLPRIHRGLWATRIIWRICLPPLVKASIGINSFLANKSGKYISNYSKSRFTGVIVRYEDVFPEKSIVFEGLEVKCPNNHEAWLISSYGKNYMQPPPENKRYPRHNIIDL